MLLGDRGAKLVFKPDGAHTGLLQTHPVSFRPWPGVEHLSQTRLDFAIAGAQVHILSQIENELLPYEAVEYLRTVHFIKGIQILTTCASLPLRDLLAKVGKSVFQVPNRYLMVAYLGYRGFATGSPTEHLGSAA